MKNEPQYKYGDIVLFVTKPQYSSYTMYDGRISYVDEDDYKNTISYVIDVSISEYDSETYTVPECNIIQKIYYQSED